MLCCVFVASLLKTRGFLGIFEPCFSPVVILQKPLCCGVLFFCFLTPFVLRHLLYFQKRFISRHMSTKTVLFCGISSSNYLFFAVLNPQRHFLFRDIFVYRSHSIAAGTISTRPGSCSGRWDVRRGFTRTPSSRCCWSVSSHRGNNAARQVGRSVGWSVGIWFRRNHSVCSSVGRSVGRSFIDSAAIYRSVCV